MTGRGRAPWLLAGAAVLAVLLASLAQPPPVGPSTRSPGGAGLLSAYAWLEARGHPVSRWERPLSELPFAEGSLVLAMPPGAPYDDEDVGALRDWMGQGGQVVLLASGGRPTPDEAALYAALGQRAVVDRADPPLLWWDWKQWRTETVTAEGPAGHLVARRETHSLQLPRGAEVLYRSADGQARAWRLSQGPGALLVVENATAFSNALMAEGDNLQVLPALLGAGPARFDEVHHGHLLAAEADLSKVVGPFELLLAHALLVYLLALWAVSRPLGPVLARPGERQGSLFKDLQGLGALHARAGHHQEAAALLLALAREAARRRGGAGGERALVARVEAATAGLGGPEALLAAAQEVGRWQREGRG
ncbi:DUF4350 domain-containing protein, partial [Myxococcota bacterium]|nr:DUF4350 domain-containing protein [Myxococcota bacterium]